MLARYARYALHGVIGCWVSACASTGDPPGGPEDAAAPVVASVTPDSGEILQSPPREISVNFDEVVNERVAGTPPDIQGAVILSPVTGATRVRWHRNRLSVRPRDGFQQDRVYRLEVLPVITDLRTNRMRTGRTVVFSTGPAIPDARLHGAVVDWVAARPVPRALIEAVLLPDSLPYRTLADSTGYFEMRQMPPGEYLVWGVMDANSDRRQGQREAFDTVRVRVDTMGLAQLYAFPHDTIAPRVRETEVVDSLTIRITFDRPLDPTLVLDTAAVHLAPQDDSTALIGVAAVMTRAELDSLRAREQRERRTADSLRADTTRARPDSTRPGPPQGRPLQVRPPVARPGQQAPRAPLDSTMAQRMIARRGAPTDTRIILLATPLPLDVRYFVFVDGARGLTGLARPTRGTVRREAQRRRP